MKWRFAAFLACSAMTAGAEPPLRVEAEVSARQPWVQSQVIYTLRAFQSAAISDILLAAPQLALAEVYPLGPATTREVERNGRRHRLHERRFAILPFASGSLQLTGAHVSGRPAGSATTTRWDAPLLSLQVQAVPAGIPAAHWLPAQQLALSETWSNADASLARNDIARRTIRIEARGVTATQIPQLVPEIPGMRVTALPPRLETRVDSEGLVAVREQDFQLLPLQSGTVAVPELLLAWWKFSAGTQGVGATTTSRLPPRTLEVTSAATASLPPPEPGQAFGILPIAGALLLAASIWLASRIRRHPLWALRRACAAGHPGAARGALLDWAVSRWPDDPPQSLPAIAARLSPEHRNAGALNDLDRHLYGSAGHGWPARQVWRLALQATLWPARRTGST